MRISDYTIFSQQIVQPAAAQTVQSADADIFEAPQDVLGGNEDYFIKPITPQGTTNLEVLINAPNPDVVIAGETKIAGIVIHIDKNVLYTYDEKGTPTKAYLIASGAAGTPTERGIRIVTHKEKFPYRSAPKDTKRYKHPLDYGPYIICLNKIDPETGEQSPTGDFIHGCRSFEATFETDSGRYVSHGCMRMDNDAITEVKEVKPGTIVIIK